MSESQTSELPKLDKPLDRDVFAMISNHPYYPTIDFFETEAEAIAAAEEEIEFAHSGDGIHQDSSVSVVRVLSKACISTDF